MTHDQQPFLGQVLVAQNRHRVTHAAGGRGLNDDAITKDDQLRRGEHGEFGGGCTVPFNQGVINDVVGEHDCGRLGGAEGIAKNEQTALIRSQSDQISNTVLIDVGRANVDDVNSSEQPERE